MKKRIIILSLMTALCMSITGCGDSSEKETAAETKKESVVETEKESETEAETELMISSIDGDWVCVDMSMDDNGTSISKEDLESMFGMKVADIIHLVAYGDGTGEMSMMGEIAPVVWKEENGKYSIYPAVEGMEEELLFTAEIVNNQLIIVEESVGTMNETEEYITKTIYTFDHNGIISKILPGWDLKLTNEEQLKMSNFMVGGTFIAADGKLYGNYNGESHGEGTFTMAEIVDGDTLELKNAKAVEENCRAYYLTEHEGYIYGILDYSKIIKIKSGETAYEVIYEGGCDYLQIFEDQIYFSDENYKFVSMGLDGGEVQTVIDQEEMYYSYILPNEMVIYQNDPDNESLHMYDLNTGNDVKLTDVVSYEPILCGDYVYYYTPVDDEKSALCRVNLISSAVETSPETIHFTYYIGNGQVTFGIGGLATGSLEEWDKATELPGGIYVMYPKYHNGEIGVAMYSDGEHFVVKDFADIENKTKIGYNYVAK